MMILINNYSLQLFVILLAIFYLLNFLDAHSTYLVVNNSSLMNEKNPIARFCFRIFGLLKGIICLKFITVLLLPLMISFYREEANEILLTLLIADILYVYVVLNNYRIFLKIKQKLS